jgi:hypothetical protein
VYSTSSPNTQINEQLISTALASPNYRELSHLW